MTTIRSAPFRFVSSDFIDLGIEIFNENLGGDDTIYTKRVLVNSGESAIVKLLELLHCYKEIRSDDVPDNPPERLASACPGIERNAN